MLAEKGKQALKDLPEYGQRKRRIDGRSLAKIGRRGLSS